MRGMTNTTATVSDVIPGIDNLANKLVNRSWLAVFLQTDFLRSPSSCVNIHFVASPIPLSLSLG